MAKLIIEGIAQMRISTSRTDSATLTMTGDMGARVVSRVYITIELDEDARTPRQLVLVLEHVVSVTRAKSGAALVRTTDGLQHHVPMTVEAFVAVLEGR